MRTSALVHSLTALTALVAAQLASAPAQAGPDIKRRNWVTLVRESVEVRTYFGMFHGQVQPLAPPPCPAGQSFLVIDVAVAPSVVQGPDRFATDPGALGAWSFVLETTSEEPTGIPGVNASVGHRTTPLWGQGGQTARLEIPGGFPAYQAIGGYIVGNGVRPGLLAASFTVQVTGACGTP